MVRAPVPVLVGCGQITQREPDPRRARAPIELMSDVSLIAAQDSGAAAAALAAVDTLVVIRSFSDTSWRFACPFGRYANPPKSLAARLGATAARRLVYTAQGGNMPQACVNRLSGMIARGEAEVALIAGGEALATQKSAERAKLALDWSEDAGGEPEVWGDARCGWSDMEDRHGMRGAIYAYPLFENAIRGQLGRTIAEHGLAMGRLLAGFAQVAAANPLADRRQGFSAEAIAASGPDNPYIGFPYTKLMNANAFIDQAAALLLMSTDKARALGSPQDKWISLHGCADAHDHWFISDRVDFHSSPAMRTVAKEAFAMAGTRLDALSQLDVYSCFPSAVEIAAREMDLALEDERGLTVTGGLPYFGGPGNNYVTHAIAEMMSRLRAAPGTIGLVTANGNYVTKQSAGIYSSAPPPAPFAPRPAAEYQAAIDAMPGPPVRKRAEGPARIETYTIVHERSGPSFAIVVGRLADGSRFMANTPKDAALLRSMTEEDMLGTHGRVHSHDGRNVFVPD